MGFRWGRGYKELVYRVGIENTCNDPLQRVLGAWQRLGFMPGAGLAGSGV